MTGGSVREVVTKRVFVRHSAEPNFAASNAVDRNTVSMVSAITSDVRTSPRVVSVNWTRRESDTIIAAAVIVVGALPASGVEVFTDTSASAALWTAQTRVARHLCTRLSKSCADCKPCGSWRCCRHSIGLS